MDVKVDAFILEQVIFNLPVIMAPVKRDYRSMLPTWDWIINKKEIRPNAFLATDLNTHILAAVLFKVFQDESKILFLISVKFGVILQRKEKLCDTRFSS
jgi:hypothetical protein